MNKYERAIMRNVIIMRYLVVAIICFNFALPLLYPNKAGIFIFLQWIVVLFHVYGYLQGTGRVLKGSLPIAQVIVIRVLQICLYTWVFKSSIVWVSMGILVGLDVLFMLLLVLDKLSYEYVVEKGD